MPEPGSSSSERVLRGRNQALQELARGATLDEVLTTLTRSAEECFADMRCAILLVDGTRLRNAAAPRLPGFYVQAIDGIEIGPERGSCGAAAALGRRVVVEDVLVHPNWEPYRDLARRAEIRACWSEPVFSSTGEVLGTFAMYYTEPRKPLPSELEFITTTAHLAGIAIERKRVEERTRVQEERFRQLAESIREVFYLTEWKSDAVVKGVLYVSPAYEAIWGRTCQSLYDDPRSWSYDIHPEDRERMVSSFLEDATQAAYDVEYRLLRPDGSVRWIHDRAFPIRDEHGEIYRVAGISEDVTAAKETELSLRKSEEENRRARDEIEALRKRQVESLVSDLLLAEERERRRIAVDLHDGLSQTIALARLKLVQLRGRAEPGLAGEIQEILDLVDEANRSSRSLTFQLSPPILHDLGFEPALHWLVEDVARTHGLEISLEGPEDASQLSERVRFLLFRAVRELLINVAKHAGATKTIVRLERETSAIRITVEDDGQAFDPDAVGSRGLGLSTIRERLNHLGGEMRIACAAGKGTRVTLVAPLKNPEPEAGGPHRLAMTLRVLLVDDHRLMREGLRKILEATPGIHVVGEAEDGHSALRAVRECRPEVVVMDVGMSGMHGIEATERLHKDHPEVRVVALSMHADKRYVRNMIRAGAAAYVLKESASEDLLRAVRAVAQGEHYLSPQITGCVLESWTASPAPDPSSAYELLGAREREVLKLLAEGKTSKEIASALEISVKTVETHRSNITSKVGLRSIAELTKYAVREGLTRLE